MWEFLVSYGSWPHVMWPLIAAAIAMFTFIASRDRIILNNWAAVAHFMVVMTSGLSFFFGTYGAPQDGIYQYLSPQAFWLNLLMLILHVTIYLVAVNRQNAEYEAS